MPNARTSQGTRGRVSQTHECVMDSRYLSIFLAINASPLYAHQMQH